MSDIDAMKEVQAIGVGLCSAGACIPRLGLSRSQVERAFNRQHPTGISSRWRLSKAKTFSTGQPQPGPCENDPQNRIHVLMEC